MCRRSDDSRSIYGQISHTLSLTLFLYFSLSRLSAAVVVCSLFLEFFFLPCLLFMTTFYYAFESLVFIYFLGAVAKGPPRRCTIFASCSKVATLCAHHRYIISNRGLVSFDLNFKKALSDTNDVKLKF